MPEQSQPGPEARAQVEATASDVRAQIGNAVCPPLAAALGRAIARALGAPT